MNLAQTLLQMLASPRGLWFAVAVAVAAMAAWVALLGTELAAADGPKGLASSAHLPVLDPANAATPLRLAGSGSTVAPLRMAIAACQRAGQSLDVQVEQGIGSSGGLRALSDGAIDAALVSRQLAPGESKAAWAVVQYARAPVTFASLPNGFDGSDGKILLGLLAGHSPRWPSGLPLMWLLREPGDSGHRVMAGGNPEFAELERQARALATAQIYFHDRSMHAALLTAEGTVGIVDASAVRAEGLPLQLYRWGAVPPDAAAVASGAWPFVKPHALVYPSVLAGRLAPLLACLRSTAGREALQRVGAAPGAN